MFIAILILTLTQHAGICESGTSVADAHMIQHGPGTQSQLCGAVWVFYQGRKCGKTGNSRCQDRKALGMSLDLQSQANTPASS